MAVIKHKGKCPHVKTTSPSCLQATFKAGYAVHAFSARLGFSAVKGTHSLPHAEKSQTPAVTKSPLQAITAAALMLPGLMLSSTHAAAEDSVDFQYSHYQEGRREGLNKYFRDLGNTPIPNNRNPIEVDSLHGSARVTLTDRIKFAFNYTEDTWSGATPLGSAPEQSSAQRFSSNGIRADGTPIIAGASPWAATPLGLFNKGLLPVYQVTDPVTGQTSILKDRIVHVMSYASPETRKQGDFKLGYEWDEAALEVGGGISIERDYESRFVNLGGRMDFNQKQTTVNLGLSYTNSDINAVLDPMGSHFFKTDAYQEQIDINETTGLKTLHGNRQDWGTQLSVTQVLNKNALMDLGMGFTRSTGFMENPYKLSWLFGVDPNVPEQLDGTTLRDGKAFIEQRPDVRNQWNWNARLVQYMAPLDAALHLDYQFAHDDWGINAHTFAADWVQPLGAGWTVTPRVRYYSQEEADFYAPFFITAFDRASYTFSLPDNFSSDQRLSGYGALSGGLTVSKDFVKGISLETGFEYYTHQGSLKLGGGGEQSFADYDYWVANAALKVNLSVLGQGGSGGGRHASHDGHPDIPAGVLFGHTLDKAGDMMVGYRYMRAMQGGELLHGTRAAGEQQVIANGCPGADGCMVLPGEMTMSMHMLDLMVAPTDRLTLMLMPQFMDMDMVLYQPSSLFDPNAPQGHGGHAHGHETGGIGDTGLYALVKLFDRPKHRLHASLGFTAPTGDAGIKIKDGFFEASKNLDGGFIHYGMQLGSGTWDFKPSLTYTGKAEEWFWGTQVGGAKRLESRNESGYALGDLFEASIWGGYDLTHWLSASVRAAYNWQGSIKGEYPRGRQYFRLGECNKADFTYQDEFDEFGNPIGPAIFHPAEYNACLNDLNNEKRRFDVQDRPSPMDAPSNYGGHYVDIGFGLSATVPHGALAGNRLSFEWLQPVYTDVNGYQLDRDGALSFTWSVGF